MSDAGEEWVEIAATLHTDEAAAWQDLLRSAGIQTRFEPDIDSVNVYPGTNIMGPYRLMVPAEIEAEARAALEDIRNPPHDSEDAD